jgi:hypothetical protein
MPRALGLVLVLAALTVANASRADVVTPPPAAPVEAPAAPEPAGSHGTLVHKPVLAGLVALLFLVMGAVAANDRHKKAASSKRA